VEFLSEVCDNFIDLHNNKLKQYDGTYEDYSKSKEVDLSYQSPPFHLANAEKIMPPFLQLVALEKTYPPGKVIFNNANLDIDLNSRIALIGVKGAGKTTLLNILAGAVVGGMSRSSNLRIGHFDQVLVEKLELDQSVGDYVQKECHAEKKSGMLQFWLSSSMRRKKTRTLMHDQKASLAFACIAAKKPHLLLIDDPTKFMDFESIESLAMALKNWEGAFVLVSNNIRLINAALCDVWVCGSKELLKIESNITELSQEIKDQNGKLSTSM
jgi:ATP-binding cassette subfamily F protein 3